MEDQLHARCRRPSKEATVREAEGMCIMFYIILHIIIDNELPDTEQKQSGLETGQRGPSTAGQKEKSPVVYGINYSEAFHHFSPLMMLLGHFLLDNMVCGLGSAWWSHWTLVL